VTREVPKEEKSTAMGRTSDAVKGTLAEKLTIPKKPNRREPHHTVRKNHTPVMERVGENLWGRYGYD